MTLNGNPLQYSCLENPMDGGARQATVYGVARVGHDWASKHTQYYQCVFLSLGFVRGGEGGPSLLKHGPVSGLACSWLPACSPPIGDAGLVRLSASLGLPASSLQELFLTQTLPCPCPFAQKLATPPYTNRIKSKLFSLRQNFKWEINQKSTHSQKQINTFYLTQKRR